MIFPDISDLKGWVEKGKCWEYGPGKVGSVWCKLVAEAEKIGRGAE